MAMTTYLKNKTLDNQFRGESYTPPSIIYVAFAEAEESWTTQAAPITHWAMFDQETGGNMLFYGQLTKTQEVPRGAILEFPENGLTTTILNA